jgi:hypothetical protein
LICNSGWAIGVGSPSCLVGREATFAKLTWVQARHMVDSIGQNGRQQQVLISAASPLLRYTVIDLILYHIPGICADKSANFAVTP